MARKERKSYTDSDKLTPKQQLGNLGEDIAEKFLMKQGFEVLERNYWKKWGEIDIVAEKERKTYFIEVKSVSRDTLPNLTSVSSETNAHTEQYRPEENIHPQKLKRLSRTIQSYLLENGVNGEWQLDAMIVYIDLRGRNARIKHIKDIIL